MGATASALLSGAESVLLLPFRKRRRPSPVLLHEPLLQIMQYAGLADCVASEAQHALENSCQ
jgi:hypothetical protein